MLSLVLNFEILGEILSFILERVQTVALDIGTFCCCLERMAKGM